MVAEQPVRCILFDMDGVLVDVSRSYRRAILDTAAVFLGTRPDAAVIQQYKDRGGLNDDWDLTQAIITDRGVAADFDDVVSVFQRHYRGGDFDGYIADESPLADHPVLEELAAAATLGIVTGRPQQEATWTVSRFGWEQFFTIILAREEQGDRPKPDAWPIRKAIGLLAEAGDSFQTQEAAYVGDTVDDMRSAVAAGVRPIGFVPPYLDSRTHGAVLREAGAAILVSHLSQLRGLCF